jgi:hypothetical protein
MIQPRAVLAVALVLLPALAPAGSPAVGPAAAPAATDLRGAVVVLERSACYGPCPIYRVEVRGDGRVTFRGEEFVRTKHPRPYRIPRARARALFAAFERAGFFALPDVASMGSCRCPTWTDNPSATLTLTLAGRTRSLVHAFGCHCAPPTLAQLADAVDEAAGVRRFIGHGKEGGLAW